MHKYLSEFHTNRHKKAMPPHDLRRPFKRAAISDQQKRRELSLQRQSQNRLDVQHQARCLANTVISFKNDSAKHEPGPEFELELELELELEAGEQSDVGKDINDVRQAARIRGPEARRWFAKQLMLPEWMIDIPDRLNIDWYVFARPAGKRCFVVSSNGTTVSRLRNGSMLHRFPSALPNGARTSNSSRSGQSYCILDCIFHEPDQTYYVIDMVCWAGMSMYECTAEFRFFWLSSKLAETAACNDPSPYNKYRFSTVHIFNCDQEGLKAAYGGSVSYVKDGLLFYNKHAHYQSGNTPLVLVWKDDYCSQYVRDTDGKGDVPDQQQVVLELCDDGKLVTSDDPPIVFGCLNKDFIQKTGLEANNLLRFAIREGGLCFADGKLERADLHYLGKPNRGRVFADSYSKVMFQYTVRHAPLRMEHLLASISVMNEEENRASDTDMVD